MQKTFQRFNKINLLKNMVNINRKYLLDKRPTGMPEDECWKLVEEETVPLKSGEILIQVKFLSIDPYMSCLLYTSDAADED